MKRLSWILTLPLIVAAVAFSIANREVVTLDLWPFDLSLSLPLFVVLLASLFVGLLIGGVASWFSAGRTRRRARQAERKVAELERELARVSRAQDASGPSLPTNPDGISRLPAGGGQPGERGTRSAAGF